MSKESSNTAIYTAYDEAVPHDPTVPEKNLLRAVLLNAMLDLKRPGPVGRKAMEYFLSKDEEYLFSFVSICDYLLVDPNRILTVTGLKPPPVTPYTNGKIHHAPEEFESVRELETDGE